MGLIVGPVVETISGFVAGCGAETLGGLGAIFVRLGRLAGAEGSARDVLGVVAIVRGEVAARLDVVGVTAANAISSALSDGAVVDREADLVAAERTDLSVPLEAETAEDAGDDVAGDGDKTMEAAGTGTDTAPGTGSEGESEGEWADASASISSDPFPLASLRAGVSGAGIGGVAVRSFVG